MKSPDPQSQGGWILVVAVLVFVGVPASAALLSQLLMAVGK